MIKFSINGCNYNPTFSTFPGGEEYVKIPKNLPIDPKVLKIVAHLTSSKEVMRLLMLNDAISQAVPQLESRTLEMPYLPYARQDRVCETGESLSVKVFCNLINAMKFDRVIIHDCHSLAGVVLLDNVINVPQEVLLGTQRCKDLHNLVTDADYILAPDAGALKKAEAVGKRYNKPVVNCHKTRKDRDTIVITTPNEDLAGKKVVVLDDICDGGGTFIALAFSLQGKGIKELSLIVTHGIFSKGTSELAKYYDNIGSIDDWGNI